MRLYHVVVINERSGTKAYFTEQPVTHDQGCAWLKKITDYPWRRKQLEEVTTMSPVISAPYGV